MKISQIIEAAYASGGAQYKKLSNEKIISMFLVHEPEMSEEGESQHFYVNNKIHVYDKSGDGEVNWVVVYPPGTYTALQRVNPSGSVNKETVYFAIDHDNEKEWETNPQEWQISHLQLLFDG